MSHNSQLRPHPNPSSFQERTLAVLLQQAFRITEEVSVGLQSTQGSIQVEALSRKLLENHILTVTRIVKQLSEDIQTLEKQVTQQDSITSGTAKAVHNLDQKNAAGVGDLRGRVARCDATIAKLSADMCSWERQLIRLQQEVADLKAAVGVQLKELGVKLYHNLLGNLESSLSEQSQGQRRSTSDLNARANLLETRMSDELKEAKEQRESLKKQVEEINSSIQRCTQQQDKTFEAMSTFGERLRALEARAEQFGTQLDQAYHFQAEQLNRSETKLSKRLGSVESILHQQLQLLKQEYHKAFLSVHDAIESLRQIADIKSHLHSKRLQKDIRDIYSQVAELNDAQ
ncbi:uncharacterized protein V6R79_021973 [Siganus canaliculatus]